MDMKNLTKLLGFFMIVVCCFINNVEAQIPSTVYEVFRVPTLSNPTPIYQAQDGLFGVGFTSSSSNINSQLTITSSLSSTQLISLYRPGWDYFNIDLKGSLATIGNPLYDPALVVENNTGNLFLGSTIKKTDYSFPARLNITVNYMEPHFRTCIAGLMNTTSSSDLGEGLLLTFTGLGANTSNAIHINNTNFSEPRVFLVKGDGTTEIGGKSYTGSYGAAKLAVNGLIAAKEIVVNTNNWYDFVLREDYKKMSLDDLENYIHANNHLPDVPTEKKVIADGFALGEMDKILLKKVEELTLYVIDLKKEIEKLKKEH
jgi:hypothetical protein